MYYIATISEIQIDEYSTTVHLQLEEKVDRTSSGSIGSLHVIHFQVRPTTLYSHRKIQDLVCHGKERSNKLDHK